PRRGLRRVWPGRGDVRAGDGGAGHRARRAAPDRPGQVPDEPCRPPRTRPAATAPARRRVKRRTIALIAVWTLPSALCLTATARLQVDLVVGRAPLGEGSWLFDRLAIPGIADMLAINPGVDGVGADIADRPILLLPHELVGSRLLGAKRPSEVMPELAMGIDLQ